MRSAANQNYLRILQLGEEREIAMTIEIVIKKLFNNFLTNRKMTIS